MADKSALQKYRDKRNFDVTPEPAEGGTPNEELRTFVIKKHWASRLHYDFRLELEGTMKSWAVPKGPSYDPADKRMAGTGPIWKRQPRLSLVSINVKMFTAHKSGATTAFNQIHAAKPAARKAPAKKPAAKPALRKKAS